MQDLTPTHTELQTLRTFHAQHEIDVLLDASFAADYRPCTDCGAMIGTSETQCYPCSQGNRARGPIYGASLAGHTARVVYMGKGEPLSYPLEDEPPVPGAALRAVEAVWITPTCHDCAAVADRSEALAAENSDLARQVVSLKGHLEAMTAQVRQGKGGGEQ